MRLFEKSGTTNPTVSSSTEIELDMESSGYGLTIEILRVMVKHVSGSAANFTVSIGNASGFTSGSINEKYVSANTAVASLLDDPVASKTTVSGFCSTSSSGKLYIKFAPNTGSNNSFSYSVMYRR